MTTSLGAPLAAVVEGDQLLLMSASRWPPLCCRLLEEEDVDGV